MTPDTDPEKWQHRCFCYRQAVKNLQDELGKQNAVVKLHPVTQRAERTLQASLALVQELESRLEQERGEHGERPEN